MPIPFIIAGVALVAGGYGVKKGIDAKGDFHEAKENNERAQSIYENAKEALENNT